MQGEMKVYKEALIVTKEQRMFGNFYHLVRGFVQAKKHVERGEASSGSGGGGGINNSINSS